MKRPGPESVLILTPLDYVKLRGNVEHHRAQQYAARGSSVTVLTKTMNESRRPLDLLVDTLGWRVDERTDAPGVRLIRLDPFFNYFAGLRRDAEERGGTAKSSGLGLLRLLSPLGLLRDLAFVPCAVLTCLRRVRHADLCLAIGAWAGLAGWLLRALGRVSTLVYVDRDFEPGLVPDALRRGVTARAETFGMRRADHVVCVGRLLVERRRREVGRAPLLLPNGVDWDAFAEARAQPPGGQALIYVGNLIAWSGLELVLRALPDLRERHPEVRLRIVGDGLPGYVAGLRRLVAELDLAQHVEFLGRRPPDELPGLLAGSDIALACSEPVDFRKYAAPLKVVEALAAGRPVVVTRGTEAADLVERTGGGVVVDYAAEALTAALDALLGDRAPRLELGRAGAEASRELDWSRLIEQELELVTASTGEPRP